VVLTDAIDINNAGQILARGSNGFYILTPVVPEPGGLALGGAVVTLLRRRSNRRR
jgi:hypothetical protein